MNNEQISQTELEDDFLLSETLGGYIYIKSATQNHYFLFVITQYLILLFSFLKSSHFIVMNFDFG